MLWKGEKHIKSPAFDCWVSKLHFRFTMGSAATYIALCCPKTFGFIYLVPSKEVERRSCEDIIKGRGFWKKPRYNQEQNSPLSLIFLLLPPFPPSPCIICPLFIFNLCLLPPTQNGLKLATKNGVWRSMDIQSKLSLIQFSFTIIFLQFNSWASVAG